MAAAPELPKTGVDSREEPASLERKLRELDGLLRADLVNRDFLLTWEHTADEIRVDPARGPVPAASCTTPAAPLRVVRHRARHLDLPRQVHAHPLQLRLGRQRPRPGRSPTSTRRSRRSPTARPCARRPT